MSTDESILAFDPFEGDFGEQGDTVLSNKMVVAAKEHECCHCKNSKDYRFVGTTNKQHYKKTCDDGKF